MEDYRKKIKEARLEAGKLMTHKQLTACNAIIHTASVACAAAGAIPIPVADAIPISAAQITMVVSLGKTFGIKITEGAAKAAISAAAACFVGRNLVKFIPVAGWVVSAGVAAGVTEAIGWGIAVDFAKQYRSDYDKLKHEETIEEEIESLRRKVDSLAEEITHDSDIDTDDDSDEEAMDPGDYV